MQKHLPAFKPCIRFKASSLRVELVFDKELFETDAVESFYRQFLYVYQTVNELAQGRFPQRINFSIEPITLSLKRNGFLSDFNANNEQYVLIKS